MLRDFDRVLERMAVQILSEFMKDAQRASFISMFVHILLKRDANA